MDNSSGSSAPRGRKTNSFLSTSSSCWFLVSFILLPITVAIIFYRLDPFDPAPYPWTHANPAIKSQQAAAPPQVIDHDQLLRLSDLIVSGEVEGPEDIVYDQLNGWIYTGCADGWIKRVRVDDGSTVVEKVVNTGGRPLGLALGHVGEKGELPELFIADGKKGLLKLTKNKQVVTLATEAEGKPFRLTDGVEVAGDGTVYFTDATSKYAYKDGMMDILEGRPHGRLLSYQPSTGETKVLLNDLYFANGVAVSPDQTSVIVCETPLRRCTKYYVKGSEAGRREAFVDHIPGTPDNIHYDADRGIYWIAIFTSSSSFMHKLMDYPCVRKAMMILNKYITQWSPSDYNSGLLAVDLEGNHVAHLYDARLSAITSGVRIGQYLYCGSIFNPNILRVNLTHYPILLLV